MKLGIGTVQMGLAYGISNTSGKTTRQEVIKVLEVAARNNIRIIDTAAQYGDSEGVLGNSLPEGHRFQIVTKTITIGREQITSYDVSTVTEAFSRSLEKLRVASVYGLLAHAAEDLLGRNGELLWNTFLDLREKGLVRKIGASIYTAAQIDALLSRYPIDIIQLPVNVLDQRLLASGHIAKLADAGVEVHARSVFLQGLLLMHPEKIPVQFQRVKQHLKRYHDTLRACGVTPVQGALGFVTGLTGIETVICGVNDHQQLEELCAAAIPRQSADYRDFAITDESVLNPSRWKGNA